MLKKVEMVAGAADCPFCTGFARVVVVEPGAVRLVCRRCRAQEDAPLAATVDEAVRVWNEWAARDDGG